MPTPVLVSVAEYLETSYRPDCEYVDGEILERNLGERDHSSMQMRLGAYLFARAGEFGICVFPEQRIQVSTQRFRVPDLCVVAGPEPQEQVFTSPPFLCVEVLSRRDTMTSMQERIGDYLAFGVPYVWILDPRLKRAFVYSRDGMREVAGVLETAGPRITVPLDALFG